MKIGLKPLLSLVLFAAIYIPATAVVLTGIGASATQATREMTEEVATIGYAQSGGIEVLFGDCISMVQSTARLDEIKQTAEGNYSIVGDSVNRIYESFALSNPYLLDIIITDASGVIFKDMREGEGSLFFGFEEARNLSRNETFVSDINISDTNYDNQNTFFVLSRVNNEDNAVGYAAMVFSTDMLADYLVACEFYEDANLFVTDRKGTALWLNGDDVTRVGEISPPGLKDIVSGVLTPQSGGSSRVGVLTPQEGGYAGGHGGINQTGNGWNWFSVYPVGKIDTLPTLILVMAVVVGVMTVACLVFAVGLMQKITNPLRGMSAKMRQINDGDIHARLGSQKVSEYSDITESFNRMMDDVLMNGEMHRAISELSDNMLFDWDYKKSSLYISDNLIKMFDIDPVRATMMNGRFIDSLMNKADAERFKIDMNRLLRTQDSIKGEYQVATRFGSVIWVLVRAHCIMDRSGGLIRVIGVITNINNEKILSLQLSERASYDFLSGLYNRDTFIRQLQSEVERNVNSRVGVIFIDVDDFKFINDRYGHNTGDEIIKHIAKVVKEKLGGNGFAGRFGGDEFVMCVTNENAISRIDMLARAVLEVFSYGYYHEKEDKTLAIKASLGIAIAPQHGRDAEMLLAAADEAMYFVKKNGKSNFFIYSPEGSVLSGVMNSI
ncbi:MAG: diguanylate cyclase [Oscillospiraceae bacterium]|nr:diguanylate cyclase [Oscillospiraceae bacterium]